ncbi:hypothetical protein Bcen2424_6522 [Burkholderia cenocepacia HI2424]|nr:hypothetical protein Bcen2424_6522 [Burkholderia cenocepacia HI2424]
MRFSSVRRGCEVRIEHRHRAMHRGRGQLALAARRQIDDAGFDAISGGGGRGARCVGYSWNGFIRGGEMARPILLVALFDT